MEPTTTLNRIRANDPCRLGWEKLLRNLGKTRGDDEALPFSKILKSNGLRDTLWCMQVEPHYAREWRLFAVACARQVQHLMTDPKRIALIDVAERCALGQISKFDMTWERNNAEFSKDPVSDVAWFACDPDAYRAAIDAAWDAEQAMGSAAAWNDERGFAGAEAWDKAAADARAAQTAELLRLLTESSPVTAEQTP